MSMAFAIDPSQDARRRILLVDNDANLRLGLSTYLEDHDFEVHTAANASEMDRALAREAFDVVLLDVMMPGEDGMQVCRRICADRRLSVMIISALSEEVDRIVGLELGADDYMAKPFNPRELLAHLRAVLRRRAVGAGAGPTTTGLDHIFNGWRFSIPRNLLLAPRGTPVPLSGSEFRMLTAFVEHPQIVLDRERLRESIRGGDQDSYERLIDVTVSRLRRKLARGDGGEDLIQTMRGRGYLFDASVSQQ